MAIFFCLAHFLHAVNNKLLQNCDRASKWGVLRLDKKQLRNNIHVFASCKAYTFEPTGIISLLFFSAVI